MAKVDVIVPCYNYGRFLEASVGSVLAQSVHDLRVLILDDASSDDSVAVARRLAEADSRVDVVAHAKNQGHIGTYNEGIAWVSSDYCLLLSADDMLIEGALERAVAVMDSNPDIVMTYGDCVAWSDHLPLPTIEQKPDWKWTRHDLLRELCTTSINTVPTPTAIVRSSVQKAIGGYRPTLPHAGDLEMWLRFAAAGGVARIDTTQAIYRKHSTAMSNAYFERRLSDYLQCQTAFETFFKENGDRVADARDLHTMASRALAARMCRYGTTMIRRGHVKDGLRLVRAAMRLDRRLSYLRAFGQLLQIPGPAGREWAMSVIRRATQDMLGSNGASVGSSLKRSQ